MIIAAIAAEEKREVVTMDIGGAYLHADMKKDVFMRLPKELSDVLVKLEAIGTQTWGITSPNFEFGGFWR